MNQVDLPFWLQASYLPNIGPRSILNWLGYFSDIRSIFTASNKELQLAGIDDKHIQAIKQFDARIIDRDLRWAEQAGNFLIGLSDPAYPSLLKEITDPPLVLYARGNISALSSTQLAMVGARHATPAGTRDAEYFAAYLAAAGLSITSGLAAGIDAASHRGALSAKGVTIAVMGTGMQHIYPAANRRLSELIVEQQGLLLSEFPLDASAEKHHFPRRNRIIAGMSCGVLVVEAALKSGSLITARYALEQGREVFAIPGSIHNPTARGCHHLIRQGAKLVEKGQDVLEELQLSVSMPMLKMISKQSDQLSFQPVSSVLGAKNRQILEQIDYAPTPIDVVVLRSGLTIGEVSSILLALELNGHVQSSQGGYVRI